MRGRATFVVLCLGLLSVAPAANGDLTYFDGKSYEQGDLKWSDRLSRREPYAALCKEVGSACFIDALRIRNDSERDIRCEISVIYPQPNKAGVVNVASVEIIAAGKERDVVHSLAVPASLLPVSFGSECAALPELAPLTAPAECKATFVRAPNPGDFYPPGSIKRNEQGPVVVEFTIAESPGAPSDITIARTSEHPDLDAAARKFIERARFETACPGQRFRKTIPFQLGS